MSRFNDSAQACRECKREYSSELNKIVFCDSCNTPYHQQCHHPQIDRIMVEVADAQWFCHECQAKRTEVPLETGISGEGIDPEVRKAYLLSLSQSQLVQLIQYAETLHPSLPLYSPHTYQLVKRIQQENADHRIFRYPGSTANENLLAEIISEHPGGIEMVDLWAAVQRKRKEPVDATFKHAASRALQRARRRGRVTKVDERYFVNADYQPSSDLTLSHFLEADDSVMFGHMPLRIPVDEEDLQVEEGDVFSHKFHAAIDVN